jgi:hypothetical protein
MATSIAHGLAGPKAEGNSIRKGGRLAGEELGNFFPVWILPF